MSTEVELADMSGGSKATFAMAAVEEDDEDHEADGDGTPTQRPRTMTAIATQQGPPEQAIQEVMKMMPHLSHDEAEAFLVSKREQLMQEKAGPPEPPAELTLQDLEEEMSALLGKQTMEALFGNHAGDDQAAQEEHAERVLKKLGELKKDFEMLDTDNSGEIDAAELEAMLLNHPDVDDRPSRAQIAHLLCIVDPNSSGSIDFQEFCIFSLQQLHRFQMSGTVLGGGDDSSDEEEEEAAIAPQDGVAEDGVAEDDAGKSGTNMDLASKIRNQRRPGCFERFNDSCSELPAWFTYGYFSVVAVVAFLSFTFAFSFVAKLSVRGVVATLSETVHTDVDRQIGEFFSQPTTHGRMLTELSKRVPVMAADGPPKAMPSPSNSSKVTGAQHYYATVVATSPSTSHVIDVAARKGTMEQFAFASMSAFGAKLGASAGTGLLSSALMSFAIMDSKGWYMLLSPMANKKVLLTVTESCKNKAGNFTADCGWFSYQLNEHTGAREKLLSVQKNQLATLKWREMLGKAKGVWSEPIKYKEKEGDVNKKQKLTFTDPVTLYKKQGDIVIHAEVDLSILKRSVERAVISGCDESQDEAPTVRDDVKCLEESRTAAVLLDTKDLGKIDTKHITKKDIDKVKTIMTTQTKKKDEDCGGMLSSAKENAACERVDAPVSPELRKAAIISQQDLQHDGDVRVQWIARQTTDDGITITKSPIESGKMGWSTPDMRESTQCNTDEISFEIPNASQVLVVKEEDNCGGWLLWTWDKDEGGEIDVLETYAFVHISSLKRKYNLDWTLLVSVSEKDYQVSSFQAVGLPLLTTAIGLTLTVLLILMSGVLGPNHELCGTKQFRHDMKSRLKKIQDGTEEVLYDENGDEIKKSYNFSEFSKDITKMGKGAMEAAEMAAAAAKKAEALARGEKVEDDDTHRNADGTEEIRLSEHFHVDDFITKNSHKFGDIERDISENIFVQVAIHKFKLMRAARAGIVVMFVILCITIVGVSTITFYKNGTVQVQKVASTFNTVLYVSAEERVKELEDSTLVLEDFTLKLFSNPNVGGGLSLGGHSLTSRGIRTVLHSVAYAFEEVSSASIYTNHVKDKNMKLQYEAQVMVRNAMAATGEMSQAEANSYRAGTLYSAEVFIQANITGVNRTEYTEGKQRLLSYAAFKEFVESTSYAEFAFPSRSAGKGGSCPEQTNGYSLYLDAKNQSACTSLASRSSASGDFYRVEKMSQGSLQRLKLADDHSLDAVMIRPFCANQAECIAAQSSGKHEPGPLDQAIIVPKVTPFVQGFYSAYFVDFAAVTEANRTASLGIEKDNIRGTCDNERPCSPFLFDSLLSKEHSKKKQFREGAQRSLLKQGAGIMKNGTQIAKVCGVEVEYRIVKGGKRMPDDWRFVIGLPKTDFFKELIFTARLMVSLCFLYCLGVIVMLSLVGAATHSEPIAFMLGISFESGKYVLAMATYAMFSSFFVYRYYDPEYPTLITKEAPKIWVIIHAVDGVVRHSMPILWIGTLADFMYRSPVEHYLGETLRPTLWKTVEPAMFFSGAFYLYWNFGQVNPKIGPHMAVQSVIRIVVILIIALVINTKMCRVAQAKKEAKKARKSKRAGEAEDIPNEWFSDEAPLSLGKRVKAACGRFCSGIKTSVVDIKAWWARVRRRWKESTSTFKGFAGNLIFSFLYGSAYPFLIMNVYMDLPKVQQLVFVVVIHQMVNIFMLTYQRKVSRFFEEHLKSNAGCSKSVNRANSEDKLNWISYCSACNMLPACLKAFNGRLLVTSMKSLDYIAATAAIMSMQRIFVRKVMLKTSFLAKENKLSVDKFKDLAARRSYEHMEDSIAEYVGIFGASFFRLLFDYVRSNTSDEAVNTDSAQQLFDAWLAVLIQVVMIWLADFVSVFTETANGVPLKAAWDSRYIEFSPFNKLTFLIMYMEYNLFWSYAWINHANKLGVIEVAC